MSDSGAGVGRDEIWIEKYRPQGLDGVLGQEDITQRLQSYIDRDELPHLLFAGPAGVGKCVTGDTPILTNQGVQFISDVVGDIEGFEEPEDSLQVLTYENGEFQYVKPDKLYSRHTNCLVSLSTRDGGEFRVTPEHKLLILSKDGFDWVQAKDLTPGDRVVRPLETPTPNRSNTLNWISFLDGDRIYVHVTREFAESHSIPIEENNIGGKKEVLRGLRRGQDIDTIVEQADLSQKTIRKYISDFADIDPTADSTICSLRYLRDLELPDEDLYNNVLKIQYVNANNFRSDPITPPDSITPSLARFLGLTIAEARLESGNIKFYNTDNTLLEDFENSAKEVFGVIPDQGMQKGVPYRRIGNRTITHFLSEGFDCFAGACNGAGIESSLVSANDECQRVFLRAFFDAEGYIDTRGNIELTQKNGDLITLLSYMLSRFGIRSRRKTIEKKATNGVGRKAEYHTLYISGSSDLSKFKENIGFGIQHKADRLSETVGRRANTNTDTIPIQTSVDLLCERLNLEKSKLVSDSLDPRSPGRNNYLEDLNRVLDAAAERIEMAQTMLEVVEGIQSDIGDISSVPAKWVDSRENLAPIEKRRQMSIRHGIGTDRLLEYADGRRSPYSNRAAELLFGLNAVDCPPPVDEVKTKLNNAIIKLDIKFNNLAQGTDLLGTSIIHLLNSESHELSSLAKFATIADQIKSAISNMLSDEVIEALVTLESITSEKIHFDEITEVEVNRGKERVYDLTVSGSWNYVAGNVPTVMHNTTSAITIAKTIYGEDWRENFLELNASDERGIDVVRDRIKNFARSSFGGYDYRLIFLDEADSLTSDAQAALRRTMEQFSNNTRFILSCNYSSKIIDPIQSRCAVFRFTPIPDEAVAEQIRIITEAEGIVVTDDGIDALVYAANGDMRKAINGLQAAAVLGETVDEEAVFTITSTARPEEIEAMVTSALEGDFTAARSVLDDLLTDKGLAGGDIIDQLHRSVWEFDIDDEAAVRLLDRIGEADYRIAEGAHERVQLEALLAAIALEGDD